MHVRQRCGRCNGNGGVRFLTLSRLKYFLFPFVLALFSFVLALFLVGLLTTRFGAKELRWRLF